MKKIKIDKDELIECIENRLTNKQMEDYFECSIGPIQKAKREYNIIMKKITSISGNILTQDILKKVLDYSKETGIFIWKENRGPNAKKGNIAGNSRKDGYSAIKLFGKQYLAHRLAFLYVEGNLPKDDIFVDHKNHIRNDNKWDNLQLVTRTENNKNKSMRADNTSGTMGVRYILKNEKWIVDIKDPTGGHFRKQFENKQEAIAVAKEKYKEFGYHENHGEQPTNDYHTRQKLIDKQTPKDVDLELLKAIKENCPKGYQIDHIQPLSKGGLHEPSNLQYITEEENRSKGNKYSYECKTTILPEDII